jgi:membrane-bound serine protease (ClpP class)
MDPLLVWGLGLLCIALVLVLLEFFVPSAGAIAITAAVCAIGGLVCLFRFSPLWGIMGLFGVLITTPLVVWAGLALWQHTPIGRRMIGAPTEEEQFERIQKEESFVKQRLGLLDKQGVALTDLRPVGVVDIEGQRHDAVTDADFISPGTLVRVTLVEATQVRVRPLG